jgi:hypothetical protein
VPVINVLYLPRDERLKTIVRTTLDLVEEVYKQGFLAGIRFVSFKLDDNVDVEQVKQIAVREGFRGLVERRGHALEPKSLLFYIPHGRSNLQYVWIPIFKDIPIIEIYDIIVHEITHLAIDRLPDDLIRTLIISFAIDTNLDDVIVEHRFSPDLVQAINTLIDEVTVMYITYNYFRELKKSPEIPTTQTYITEFALDQYRGIIMRYGTKLEHTADAVAKLLHRVAHTDLAFLRVAVHQVFETMIKRFPADVYESNRAKYGILYRKQRIQELPL